VTLTTIPSPTAAVGPGGTYEPRERIARPATGGAEDGRWRFDLHSASAPLTTERLTTRTTPRCSPTRKRSRDHSAFPVNQISGPRLTLCERRPATDRGPAIAAVLG
jgi:hypothetical protein